MKALTIYQPWASLIIVGAKPWEWRGWAPPKWLIGQRMVIHASVRPPRPAELHQIIADIDRGDSSLVPAIARPLLQRALDRAGGGTWMLGAGLGTAIVGAGISAIDWAEKHEKPGYDSDRIDHHMFGWPLTDIRPFTVPIPVNGKQGLWDWAEGLGVK